MTDPLSFNDLPLVPAPAGGRLLPGSLTLSAETAVEVPAGLGELAGTLRDRLALLEGETGDSKIVRLRLVTGPTGSALEEGYVMRVLPGGVRLDASTRAGLFYGLQTLSQLIDAHTVPGDYAGAPAACVLPCMEIEDQPRFPWRGMMLDVSRHFLTTTEVKTLIDRFASLKLNAFHWHLTDDQGWRIEIKSRPELTVLGSIRPSSPLVGDRLKSDGVPYGPFFYTQAEIRDVVEYARQRHVTIVPEIDLPGHVVAALACYPELSCAGGPFEVRTAWGVEDDVLCLGNPASLEFVFDVLGEMAELFPGPFLHIGGDEAPITRWENCPCCQAAAAKAGVGPVEGLRKIFVRELESFLAARGKRAVCWDEVLDDDPGPGAIIASWRGTEAGIRAAARGNDVVMCPHTHCYFDYRLSDDPGQTLGAPNGLYISLEDCYGYDPVDVTLTPAQAGHILGPQGNIWTEYMWSAADVHAMAFPRAHAIAEIGWSPRARRDFTAFSRRLGFVHKTDESATLEKKEEFFVDLI